MNNLNRACYFRTALYRSSFLAATAAIVWFCGALGAFAETFPPGPYTEEGRVVQKADGEFVIFWGMSCARFPKEAQAELKPYLGRFVKVDYTRVKGAGIDMWGSAFGKIDKITILAETPDLLPLRIKIHPEKKTFSFDEPIVVHVRVTNATDAPRVIQFGAGATALCQDYGLKLRLESDEHYYDKHPYGLPGNANPTLLPGESLEYDVVSQNLAEPGEYQLVHSLPAAGTLRPQSELERIVVLDPKSEAERVAALQKWLSRAQIGQRIQIAEKLLEAGNRSGVTEVLRLLKAGEYSRPTYCNGAAFQFGFQRGGVEGERVMMELIRSQHGQDCARRMIEYVYLSPRREKLLEELFACAMPTVRSTSGWVENPRICDIAADWLAGYSNQQIKFPADGSVAQRNAAIAQVRIRMAKAPESFEVLTRKLH